MMIDKRLIRMVPESKKLRCRKCSDAVDFTCGKRGAYDEYHSLFLASLYAKNCDRKGFCRFRRDCRYGSDGSLFLCDRCFQNGISFFKKRKENAQGGYIYKSF